MSYALYYFAELKKAESLWFATNPSKRWGEIFVLCYTPFWMILCLGIVVPFRLYEVCVIILYLPVERETE